MSTLQRHPLRVKLFQRIADWANRLARLPNRLLPAPFRVMQMGTAYWQSRALFVAAQLGIADTLGEKVKSTAEIAETLSLDEDHLYRLLRMLASLGVFEECGERRFRNNRLSTCLRRDHPQSVCSIVLMHNSPEMSRPWYEELGPAMHSGEIPFARAHGDDLFSYMDKHPEFDALFSTAMKQVEALTGTAYLEDFDWSGFTRIIDVGGSSGSKSIAILTRQPQLQALVFDRPQSVANMEEYWHGRIEPGTLQRLQFCGGDMLESLPAAESNRDLYLFVAIFHGMSDSYAGKVLANLRSACGQYRPTIVIADTVAQDQNIDPTIAAFDMQMLIGTRGRERTLTEWVALLQRHQFTLREVVDVRTFAKLLVVDP